MMALAVPAFHNASAAFDCGSASKNENKPGTQTIRNAISLKMILPLPFGRGEDRGENSPKNSRIEPMNRRKTSNTQHPTSNNQWFPIGPLIGGWVLDVGCWMFGVPKGSWGGQGWVRSADARSKNRRGSRQSFR